MTSRFWPFLHLLKHRRVEQAEKTGGTSFNTNTKNARSSHEMTQRIDLRVFLPLRHRVAGAITSAPTLAGSTRIFASCARVKLALAVDMPAAVGAALVQRVIPIR